MADISITAASVQPGAGQSLVTGLAGEAIAAGKTVYFSSTTKKWQLANSKSGTAEARTAGGIAVNGAAAGQPVTVQKSGEVTLGAVLTAGSAYYLSETSGGIQPAADLGSGETVCLLGIAKSTSVLSLAIQAPGVVL